jgi:hypothetical protein
MAGDVGEIRFTYQKLEEGAKSISDERIRFSDYEKKHMGELCADLGAFRSEFAQQFEKKTRAMDSTKLTNLTESLDAYSAALATAKNEMQALEESIAEKMRTEGR